VEEATMRKRLFGALLAIASIMMMDSGMALLQSTNTIPSTGTIGSPQQGVGQAEELETGYHDAYHNSPVKQELTVEQPAH
jgi:hypothetical protein